MAVTPNAQPCTQAIQNDFASLANATGAVGTTLTTSPSNSVLLSTAGANGSLVKSLMVCSDDSAARVLVIYVSPDSGTTKYPIGTANIPLNSGATGAIGNIDLLNSTVLLGFPVDQAGRNIIQLAPSNRIYVGVQVAVTAAKFINIMASLENF